MSFWLQNFNISWQDLHLLYYTRSLGALRAPTSRLRPFGPAFCHAWTNLDSDAYIHDACMHDAYTYAP